MLSFKNHEAFEASPMFVPRLPKEVGVDSSKEMPKGTDGEIEGQTGPEAERQHHVESVA